MRVSANRGIDEESAAYYDEESKNDVYSDSVVVHDKKDRVPVVESPTDKKN